MTRLTLKPRRDYSVRRHHPWIFSGAFAEPVVSGLASGETVEIASAEGEILGYGSYSPASMIRVRMLTFGAGTLPDAAFITQRVRAAVERRARLLTGDYTNAVRLIHAEADGLPGVVADCYAGWVICQFTSAGAEFWKPTIVAALKDAVSGCCGVCERTDLKDREKEGLATVSGDFAVLAGEEPPELIAITEGPCSFWVDVRRGHKTGFYLDQRAARQKVGSWAQGADVLNCFSYTGGFGLFARANGAKSVTQVDISEDALALARKNAALTASDSATPIDYVATDVFQYLRTCRDMGRTFDLIVLDPPKFAAVKSQVARAARGYKDINLLAMKLLRPNGILATFSCSGAMTPELFDQVLAEAAADAHRDFQVVGRTQQDVDHPAAVAFPEGLYLKGAILRFVV